MFELSIRTRFSAAHHIEGYAGACAAHHGHNWEVEVFVRGQTLDRRGLLVDFRKMKRVVGRVVNEIDHTDLNTVETLRDKNPTSENIAEFLYHRIGAALNTERYRVHRVVVGETSETRAAYWEESE